MNNPIKWAFLNGLFAALCVLWLVYHNNFAHLLFLVMFWSTILIAALAFLIFTMKIQDALELMQKRLDKVGFPSVPVVVDRIYDACIVILLCYFNHYILGVLWVFQMYVIFFVLKNKNETSEQYDDFTSALDDVTNDRIARFDINKNGQIKDAKFEDIK